jgi:hypothetical protein
MQEVAAQPTDNGKPWKLICQICGETIASFFPSGITLPLMGSMFMGPDPLHDVEPPFEPSQTWEYFQCPHGRNHRPMLTNDLISTDHGVFQVLPETLGLEYMIQIDPSSFVPGRGDHLNRNTMLAIDQSIEKLARMNLGLAQEVSHDEPAQEEDVNAYQEDKPETAESDDDQQDPTGAAPGQDNSGESANHEPVASNSAIDKDHRSGSHKRKSKQK